MAHFSHPFKRMVKIVFDDGTEIEPMPWVHHVDFYGPEPGVYLRVPPGEFKKMLRDEEYESWVIREAHKDD